MYLILKSFKLHGIIIIFFTKAEVLNALNVLKFLGVNCI